MMDICHSPHPKNQHINFSLKIFPNFLRTIIFVLGDRVLTAVAMPAINPPPPTEF